MRRSLFPLLFLTLLFAGEAVAQENAAAQETAARETSTQPPVRYDTDRLPASFHRRQRQALLETLPKEAVAVFFSAPKRTRENDIAYEYNQNSDLYYLTGTTEAASILLLSPRGIEVDGERVQELLLVPPRTEYSDTWLGRRFGPQRAEEVLGIEKAISNERFDEITSKLAGRKNRRFYHLPLPYGVEEDSELARQLATFQSQVVLLPDPDSRLARRAVRLMRTVDEPKAFSNFQEQFKNRLDPASFESKKLQEAYQTFIATGSLKEWKRWRAKNLDATVANGTKLQRELTRMRLTKSEEEMRLLRRAIDLTVEAQKEAMRSIEPGMHEYEIEALVEYIFKRGGAEEPGFPSIIGSGENATVLHYETNRRQMQAGDMVVVDIGAEYHGYSADVTRSVPVDGSFSKPERAIYEVVLRAQKAAIEAARPGNNFRDPDQVAHRIIGEGLVNLGLIETPDESRRFFMHGTSHYLGLYTHDIGSGGPLPPGTVITVEPGIYIGTPDDVDEKWHNIGVRIEDDILITENGPMNLSKGAPREIENIEALMRKQGLGNTTAGASGLSIDE